MVDSCSFTIGDLMAMKVFDFMKELPKWLNPRELQKVVSERTDYWRTQEGGGKVIVLIDESENEAVFLSSYLCPIRKQLREARWYLSPKHPKNAERLLTGKILGPFSRWFMLCPMRKVTGGKD